MTRMRGFHVFNDGSIPETHRSQVLRASQLINDAAGLVGGVRMAYPLHDPLADELSELLARLNVLLLRCDTFLAAHPARKQ